MTEWVEEDDGSWTLGLSLGSLRVYQWAPEIGGLWIMHAQFPPLRHGAMWIVGRLGDNIEDVRRAAIKAALKSLDEARAELRSRLRTAKLITHPTAKRTAR